MGGGGGSLRSIRSLSVTANRVHWCARPSSLPPPVHWTDGQRLHGPAKGRGVRRLVDVDQRPGGPPTLRQSRSLSGALGAIATQEHCDSTPSKNGHALTPVSRPTASPWAALVLRDTRGNGALVERVRAQRCGIVALHRPRHQPNVHRVPIGGGGRGLWRYIHRPLKHGGRRGWTGAVTTAFALRQRRG